MKGTKDTTENIDTNSQRKCKRQRAPNTKYPENLGHNEKRKPKDNRYRREWRFPI